MAAVSRGERSHFDLKIFHIKKIFYIKKIFHVKTIYWHSLNMSD